MFCVCLEGHVDCLMLRIISAAYCRKRENVIYEESVPAGRTVGHATDAVISGTQTV